MADTYYQGTGRRKRSIARVMIKPGSGQIEINGRSLDNYFPIEIIRQQALLPLTKVDLASRFDVRINVIGGGVSGQAGAVRHGLARALLTYDAGLRAQLKAEGFLRDRKSIV